MNPGNIKTRESGSWQQRPVGKRNNALGTWDGSSTPSFRDPGEVVYSTDGGTSWLPLEGATWTDGDAYPIGFIVDYNGSGTRTTPLSDNEPVPSTAGSRVEYYIGNPDSGGTLLRDDDTQPAYDAKSGAAAVTTAELGGVGSVTLYARCVYPDATIDDHTASLTIEASGGGGGGAMLSNGFTRESLLSEREGEGRFAGGTGNGDANDSLLWTEIVVTNLNDSGPGSLREAMSSGSRWVVFSQGLSGNITLSSEIVIPSRIVVDGRAAAINFRITNADSCFTTQFTGGGVDNYIMSYLSFELTAGAGEVDGIRNATGQDVWFHHIQFDGLSADNTSAGDGSIDSTPATSGGRKPDRITISWCRFENWNKTMLCHLVGGSSPPLNDWNFFTLHHNLFRNNAQRNPRSQNAKLHFYNNWLDGWGDSGGSGNGVELFNETRFVHENNIYSATNKTQAINSNATAGVSGRTDAIVVDLGGNVSEGGATFSENRAVENDYTPSYSYTAQTANATLKSALEANAGNN